jgi:hypothetical protein
MRWIRRVLFVFVSLIVLPAVGLAVNHRFETIQTEMFYANRPMLRAMRDVMPTSERPNPQPPYVDALFERVPRGTTRNSALGILASEGLACERSSALNTGMVCSALSEKPVHEPNWHIELVFDQDEKLTGGRALALK